MMCVCWQLGEEEDEESDSEEGSEGEEKTEKPAVYRPPKLAAMHYGMFTVYS